MNINSLTIKAQEALQAEVSLAREQGNQAVEPLHLLNVLVREDDSLSVFLPVSYTHLNAKKNDGGISDPFEEFGDRTLFIVCIIEGAKILSVSCYIVCFALVGTFRM